VFNRGRNVICAGCEETQILSSTLLIELLIRMRKELSRWYPQRKKSIFLEEGHFERS
jgi:hypothetical protein